MADENLDTSSSDAPNQTAGDPVRSTVDNDLSLLASIIQEELELARSGDGYEEQAVAEEIVRSHVAPVLAERDEVKAVLRAEVAQQKSNWDAARDANMTALETIGTLKDERQLLLWLHAEAVWQRDAAWEELDEHNEAAVEHYAENARLRAATERDARIIDRYRGELISLRAELERERQIKAEVLDTNQLAIKTLQGLLRQRNREYGRASATIGLLRGALARDKEVFRRVGEELNMVIAERKVALWLHAEAVHHRDFAYQMLERVETQHVTWTVADNPEEVHPDWCRECRVDKLRDELDALKEDRTEQWLKAHPPGRPDTEATEQAAPEQDTLVGVIQDCVHRLAHEGNGIAEACTDCLEQAEEIAAEIRAAVSIGVEIDLDPTAEPIDPVTDELTEEIQTGVRDAAGIDPGEAARHATGNYLPYIDGYPVCGAHQRSGCELCSLNPGVCGDDPPGLGACQAYGLTRMHWTSCPNRVEQVVANGVWRMANQPVTPPAPVEQRLCREDEGCTGITCDRPEQHPDDHEGTATTQQAEYVGYSLTVSWPRTPHDRCKAPLTEVVGDQAPGGES